MAQKLKKQAEKLRVLLAKASHYLVLTAPPKRQS